MVSCVEMKIQGFFFAKKNSEVRKAYTEVSENKRYVSVT